MSSQTWATQVKYSRLPMSDSDWHQQQRELSGKMDFTSAFNFDSAFTYSKMTPPYVEEERSYHPSLVTRICSNFVLALSFLFVFLTFPITGWFVIKNLQQFERVVVFRLGRLQPPKGPGLIMVLPFVDNWRRVDMSTRAFNVPPQQILTNDGAAISIGATVYHRITDASLSVASVQDLNHATRVLGQIILLNLLSVKSLAMVENYKSSLNDDIQKEMNTATQSWGVEVSRVELSELTVIQEAGPMSAQKVGGILGQLAGQITGSPGGSSGGNWMQQLIPGMSQQLLVPPKPAESTIVEIESASVAEQTAALTPDQVMALVGAILEETLVHSIGATYEFHITGDNGGTYYLDLKTGSGTVGKGTQPIGFAPDAILTMSVENMQAMFSGEVRPFAAYMTGQLQLEGDRGVAMKLETVIQRVQMCKC